MMSERIISKMKSFRPRWRVRTEPWARNPGLKTGECVKSRAGYGTEQSRPGRKSKSFLRNAKPTQHLGAQVYVGKGLENGPLDASP